MGKNHKPEHRAREHAKKNARYAADPVFREKIRAKARASYRKLLSKPGWVEATRAKSRARYARLKDDPAYRAQNNLYRTRYRNKPENKAYHAEYGMRRRHGFGLARKNEILLRQAGRCALCRTDNPGRQGWHVDHDHATSEIRGVLCGVCNVQLGVFESLRRRFGMSAINTYIDGWPTPEAEVG